MPPITVERGDTAPATHPRGASARATPPPPITAPTAAAHATSTKVATLLALTNLLATLLLLAAGNYGARPTLLHIGSVTEIIIAGRTMYLAAAEIREATYREAVIPLGRLGK